MKKLAKFLVINIIISCLSFLPFRSFAQVDTISESSNQSKIYINFLLGAGISYFDYNDLGFFEIADDYRWGATVGMSLDWFIIENYGMRLEAVYDLQRLESNYSDDFDQLNIVFRNHAFGMNIFPVVGKIGNKLKPSISLGIGLKINAWTSYTVELNQIEREANFDIKSMQTSFIMGLGLYINKMMIETRIVTGLSDFVKTDGQVNKINQIQLIFSF